MKKWLISPDSLLPAAWREFVGAGPVNAFNPSIVALEHGLAMAYRVVLSDGRRRVAIVRMTLDNEIDSEKIVPLSDQLQLQNGSAGPLDWVADPRLVMLGGRLHMHFNSGDSESPNRIFIVELSQETLKPIGPVREVTKDGDRRRIEKNWMFFDWQGGAFVIYSMSPLVIMRADMSAPDRVVCTPVFAHEWDSQGYEEVFGELRGGATPIRSGDHYHIITHSSFTAERAPADEGGELVYVGAALVLSTCPPFKPLFYTPQPVVSLSELEQALPHQPRLDPRCWEAAYPAGAACDENGITISYGINERYAALQRMPWGAYWRSLTAVVVRTPDFGRKWRPTSGPSGIDHGNPDRQEGPPRSTLRGYWWQPDRKSARRIGLPSAPGSFAAVHGNFGDLAVPHLIGRITGLHPANTSEGPRLLTVGSLIQAAQDGDVIWGTGVNGGTDAVLRHAPSQLHAYAVRGPISYDVLRRGGFDVSRVTQLFDPVSVVGHLLKDEIDLLRPSAQQMRNDFIIIPHFRDEIAIRRLHPQYESQIHSPDTPFMEMVHHLLACDLVISSSLHGIILAETLGTPAVWLRPIMGEDELKFYDYYYGTGRYRVVRAESVREALRVKPMRLPILDAPAMIATFPPAGALHDLGVLAYSQPIVLGEWVDIAAGMLGCVVLGQGWGEIEEGGSWSTADSAVILIDTGDEARGPLDVQIKASAFVPTADRPQEVKVWSNAIYVGEFAFENPETMSRHISFPAQGSDGAVLSLRMEFPTAVSPKDLSVSGDLRRLGIHLQSIRVVPRHEHVGVIETAVA